MQARQVSESGPRDDSSDERFFKIESVLVIQSVIINLKSRPAATRDMFVSDGKVVPGNVTVAGSGISALDIINVGWGG